MSNSSLIKCKMLSPNHYKGRTHTIDTITIHCMAGDLSVERCGELFLNASREASSNYGIGSDGRIALYVDEANGSWCSYNKANDMRAVTIEVANDGGEETGWHVSEKAMQSLIELVADICKRNGIKELKWQADKRLIGQVDRQNMTVHRWFEAKACPGEYLYSKHAYIADEVNKKLGRVAPAQPKSQEPEYRVKTKEDGWLPPVIGLNDYAGWKNHKIVGFAVKVPDKPIKYRVHTVNGKWLPYVTGYNINDINNGYAGDGKTAIDAIEIVCSGAVAKYRVQDVAHSYYYPYQRDNQRSTDQDGYAGSFGKAICKVQVTLA